MSKLKKYKPSDLKRLKYKQIINIALKKHGILKNVIAYSYHDCFYLTYDLGRNYVRRPASILIVLFNGEHITIYIPNIKWFEVLSKGKRFISNSKYKHI